MGDCEPRDEEIRTEPRVPHTHIIPFSVRLRDPSRLDAPTRWGMDDRVRVSRQFPHGIRDSLEI